MQGGSLRQHFLPVHACINIGEFSRNACPPAGAFELLRMFQPLRTDVDNNETSESNSTA